MQATHLMQGWQAWGKPSLDAQRLVRHSRLWRRFEVVHDRRVVGRVHQLVQCWVSIVGNDRVQPMSCSAVKEIILQAGEQPWGIAAVWHQRHWERAGCTASGQDAVVAAESRTPSQSLASALQPWSCEAMEPVMIGRT